MTIRPASWAATMSSGLGKQRSREDTWRGGRGDCERLEKMGKKKKKQRRERGSVGFGEKEKSFFFFWTVTHSLRNDKD